MLDVKSSADIRQAFLDFFAERDHRVVASSSLVPGNDPTLLFTNAGMVQFKDVFLGAEQRDYQRATSSQRCVRAGGKHNDLENVGYTARHHTFFEMLGNFSFGDYFKRDAIKLAWTFLTEVLGLPAERLWITVHISDDEAEKIWLEEMGVSAERFSRLDEDNFWQMGDTGPCGPCSEIFYDHGADVPGGPPGSSDDDLDRYIEIWNLVFMQYERDRDGVMTPLPKPSIDTGMGLERIAAIMQGVHSNYEIDLFQHLIKAAAEATGGDDLEHNSLRVIADHIRSASFLIVDGVLPSNEGRGYVLRRIIRRALRHGHNLGMDGIFFNSLVAPLVEQMGAAYPELAAKQKLVEKALLAEEEQFSKTLDKGMGVLTTALADLSGKVIPGEVVFKLYDTYGFPLDLTNDIAREQGYELDTAGYESCMEEQKTRARAASRFGVDYTAQLEITGETAFVGYQSLNASAQITGLFREGTAVAALNVGDEAMLVLDNTAFYAESGGQAGDRGELLTAGGRFVVSDCQKQGDNHLHCGQLVEGEMRLGEAVNAQVDSDKRQATALNHSATHLLHAALRKVLGEHVVQKGSLVDAERVRFDFANPQAMTADEIKAVEALVNSQIRDNSAVQTQEMSMDEAQNSGAMALFGEKYGDSVRVLTMGEGFSVELCGGTHAQRTGDIGLFHITSESGVAAGVRRVEALAGVPALAWFEELEQTLDQVTATLKAGRANVLDKAAALVDSNRALNKELDALKVKLASASGGDLLDEAKTIAGVAVLAKKIDGADAKTLRDMLDQLRSRMDKGVIMLAAESDGKIALSAGVSKNLTADIKAGALMQFVAPQIGGKGGGRADMAQGGGTDSAALPAALESVYAWVEEHLSA
ncbi:MAG: alanine--tRNA ligase [Gammaproteobacteria bacterium]|nr:alanine--tRNA ligase [Gammaproteobacteria bacterium]MBQ0839413.1 alanine--tRNA ligase [Gammaproteobacteria bacterium]